MKASRYERGTHNCLEHIYETLDNPKTYRCFKCLRPTPPPKNIQELFDAQFEETNNWWKVARLIRPLTHSQRWQFASWSTTCPECSRYIRKHQSRVVELLEPHRNHTITHRNGQEHFNSGVWIHFDCLKAMIRRQDCVYCGAKRAGTVDHVIAVFSSGEDQPKNLVPCCASCNSKKGIKSQAIRELRAEFLEEPAETDQQNIFREGDKR
jgi:5-methylcytosine-specific restriction endonuclease McrA